MWKMQSSKLCLTFAPGRQQSPPSYPQPMLLFPRSQRPSPTYNLTLSLYCHPPTPLLWALARGERSAVGCVQSPDVVLGNLPALTLLLVDPIRLALTIWVDRLEGGKASKDEIVHCLFILNFTELPFYNFTLSQCPRISCASSPNC